jgi:hypothetical protein
MINLREYRTLHAMFTCCECFDCFHTFGPTRITPHSRPPNRRGALLPAGVQARLIENSGNLTKWIRFFYHKFASLVLQFIAGSGDRICSMLGGSSPQNTTNLDLLPLGAST